MEEVFIMDHPLIQHKISRLRDETTGTNEFRKLVEEIGMLMGYEALRDLKMEKITVKTPIEECEAPVIAGKKLAIVPILRAGLGMVSGMLALVPSAKVGHIGLYRDHETHEPHEYYCKLPDPIEERGDCCPGSDARDRRVGGGCDQFCKAARREEDKVHVYYCGSGRGKTPAESTSGCTDLLRVRRPGTE